MTTTPPMKPPRVTVVIGPPKHSDEVGLEHPIAMQISIAEQVAWGLRGQPRTRGLLDRRQP